MLEQEIGPNSIVSAIDRVHFSKLDEDLLGIDQEAGFCYSINVSGARILELLDHPMPVRDVCRKLRSEFAVEEGICEQQVCQFLTALQQASLIEVSNGPRRSGTD